MKRKKRNTQPKPLVFTTKFTFFHRHPWLLYPLFTLLGLSFIGGLFLLILSRNLPSLTELEKAGDPLLVTRIYSQDGKVLTELFKQKRIKVPLDQMPDHLLQATLASEDRKFYDHWGLDIRSIFKFAFLDIIKMRIVGGASTLTQQLAKKLYLHPRKTIIRKLREGLTALQIERTYSKPEILEMYLNQMPLGRGTHGVQAATQAYFRKNVEDLRIEESALIIGLLQLPYGYYHPDRDPEAAMKRRNVILQSMLACDYITTIEYDSLSQIPLNIVPKDSEGKTIAPYFCEYVRQMMQEKYGMRLFTDGLNIQTTLDTRVQACADSAVKAFLPGLEKEVWQRIIQDRTFLQWLDPVPKSEGEIKAFLADSALVDSLLTERATLQVAVNVLNPTNGHILAMIGGRDFEKWKYNTAVQAKRQPGSAFKPIVYTVAIDNGWPTTTELLNQPLPLFMPDGTIWNPSNYDGSTGGPTTLREALKRSLNLVTVRLVQEKIPKEQVVKYAKQFGLTTQINPYDAIALGSDVVIPLELTAAFSVFTNRGVWVEPVAVLEVRDKDGNLLEENVPRRREVISEETAYIITDMLSDVINAPRGTGHATRWKYNFYRPAAGKTGTTNDFRNAWFIGYTPQICAGVWVGFGDERISLGEDQSGAKTALPIWAPFMRMTYDSLNLPLADFVQPPGVVRLKICRETKKLATKSCPEIIEDVYTLQTVPTDSCDVHTDPWKFKGRRRRDRVIF